jgi:hypothetical protein
LLAVQDGELALPLSGHEDHQTYEILGLPGVTSFVDVLKQLL